MPFALSLLILLFEPSLSAAPAAPFAVAAPAAVARPAAAATRSAAAAPAAAGAVAWQRPVDGRLLRRFALGSDVYARGQHRGVDLAATIGSPVRSACAGRVSFAGRVPGGGRTVSVRCGALVATYQQLGALEARAGRRVARGGRIGTVGASADPRTRRPHVHLGVREAATHRYLDPLELLGGGGPVPLLPAPRRPSPLGRAPGPPVSRRVPPVGVPAPPQPHALPLGRAPVALRAPAPHAVAWVAWAGLGAVGVALPVGGLVRLRRRSRAAPARAAAAAR